jgi:hypothetical protein
VEPRFFEMARRLVEERESRRAKRLKGALALVAVVSMTAVALIALGLLTPTPKVARAGVALKAGEDGGAFKDSFTVLEASGGLAVFADVEGLESDAVFGFKAVWHGPAGDVAGTCEQSRNHAREARLPFWCHVVLHAAPAPGEWRVTLSLDSRHSGDVPLAEKGTDKPLELRFRVAE